MRFTVVVIILMTDASSRVNAEKMRFDNHTVYRIIPKTKEVIQALKSIEEQAFLTGYNFLSDHILEDIPVDILVPPSKTEEFKTILNFPEVKSKLLVPNIQKLIDDEGFRPEDKANTFTWDNYHTLDEINNWLRDTASNYPDKASLLVAGKTYQGRDILGLKISYSPNDTEHSIFIEANIHAREWITSAVATYLINALIVNTDPHIRDLASSYDWYIFPVANPDGFKFSHTFNRMWRKTLTPHSLLCFGADPNRNFPFEWMQGGASDQPCSNTYGGPYPLSEASTDSLSTFIDSIGYQLDAYIGFHSYSQMLLIPYGHTTEHLDNYAELMDIGRQAIADLATRYGTRYVVGTIAETIYIATGSSMDWVKHKFGTPITYTYELRDTGNYGFILPADQIIPTSLETIDSLVSIFRSYRQRHPRN